MNTIAALLVSAIIPLIIGFIWYNPKVFGKFWMRVADVTEEKLKTGNMAGILILTYVLGFLMSAAMLESVIHQYNVFSIFANTPGAQDPNSEIGQYIADFMAKYGTNFRTFKHGAFHGFGLGLLFATPVVAINAMFERRGFKYILVHAGYWTITVALMGGVICQFAA